MPRLACIFIGILCCFNFEAHGGFVSHLVDLSQKIDSPGRNINSFDLLEFAKIPSSLKKFLRRRPFDEALRQQARDTGSDRSKRNALDANTIVDALLKYFGHYVVDHNMSEITIPDQHLGSSFWYSVDVKNGKVKDLSTLQRTSEFNIVGNLNEDEFKVEGGLGLGVVDVTLDYSAKAIHIGPSGHIHVTVGKNAVDLSIWGKLEGLSKFIVKKLEIRIKELSDIKISLTGLGIPLNYLTGKLTNWIVNLLNSKIKNAIESAVKVAIDTKLQEMNYTIPLNV